MTIDGVHKLGINHCHFSKKKNQRPYCEYIHSLYSSESVWLHFGFMSTACKRFFRGKQSSVRACSEYSLLNSLNNLRCLFMSDHHKSLYWQPIDNSRSFWWRKFFLSIAIENLISLFTLRRFQSNVWHLFKQAVLLPFGVRNRYFFSFSL